MAIADGVWISKRASWHSKHGEPLINFERGPPASSRQSFNIFTSAWRSSSAVWGIFVNLFRGEMAGQDPALLVSSARPPRKCLLAGKYLAGLIAGYP